MPERHVEELGLDRNDPRLALTLELTRQLVGTPRHLSQHPGGFVLTRDRLDDLVPIEPAAMVDRRVIEWEKDDLEELKIMKLDVLGLGMLGCMRRAFDLLRAHKGIDMNLWSDVLQEDDPAVFAMIRKADTIGTFQIESRAQMSMLPRMKPKEFYDIVIQVAIVRPGPIQGDMVHPYLRRREGKEKVEFPSPELEAVLGKTLGVPLFQEQAMNVAIVGAGFSPSDADRLRRSMATFKSTGGVSRFQDQMIEGMVARGYTRDFAERTFRQIEGFGSYGFPESHAASFAKIAYASSWMKCHHPDVFCAAILNAQPMGFYQPAQLVRDAQNHGVEVRPVCINRSRWDCTMEEGILPVHAGEGDQPKAGGGVLQSPCKTPPPPLAGGPPPRERGEDLAPPPPRPAHGPRPLQPPRRPDPRRPRRSALRLDRGRLAPLRSARRRAREARRRRRLRLTRPRPPPGPVAGARARRGALAPVRRRRRPRRRSPKSALTPLTGGREVVEDYRTVQLSLRAHPARLPARRAGAEGDDLRRPRPPEGRRPGRGGRPRPHPPAAGQGQRHLHHPRGRDRNRQHHPLAAQVRGAEADRDGRGDDRGEGA